MAVWSWIGPLATVDVEETPALDITEGDDDVVSSTSGGEEGEVLGVFLWSFFIIHSGDYLVK